VASGHSTIIEFTPLNPVAHTIYARVVGDFGLFQDVAQTVNVSAFGGTAEAGVDWSKLVYTVGENLVATIRARDSRSSPPSKIVWTLYRNGQLTFSGEGANVNFSGTMSGQYRLKGVAYCNDGSQLGFDSTAFVSGSVNVRHTLPIPDEGGTAVYLGAVYTQNLIGGAGTATTLPYQIGSSTEDIFFLPGTTHWTFDLDPEGSAVDDEVVVRTQKGNWCLNGLAGGLAGENVGYDYGYMPTLIPVPTDRRVKFTADFFKVHGLDYNSFNSRVRIKCYRRLPGGVYRYERCAYSSHPGGEGRRTRRWAVVFSHMDVQTDVYSGLNRFGTGDGSVPYATTETTSIPLMAVSTSGTPNPVPGYSGLFYTDSNLYAFYEADAQHELSAKAVSGIEGVRPCCISLLMFNQSKPVILNRINRVYGKVSLYLMDGVLLAGSVVTVKIWNSDSFFTTDYIIPVTTTTYVNEDNVLLKVGEHTVNLFNWQFDETGIVVDFSVDESAVVDSAIPSPVPTPVTSPDFIYSPNYAHSVQYDGACYTNPVYVPFLDDNAVLVTPISGCQDPLCGPAALYCYTALDAPAENIVVPQPFGFPAPYVANGTNPARCYYNPVAVADVSGTNVSLAEFTGSAATDLWSYSGTSLCGASYAYNDCQTSYAPCAANTCSIIVVYPVSSSPHANVEYAGRCYYYTGSTHEYGTRSVVAVADVNPVIGCHDPVCNLFNANGSVVVYNDMQTDLEVPVTFEHLDYGTAHYGAAPQKIDNWESGLVDGQKVVIFKRDANVLVYTSIGTGSMMFEFRMSGVNKQIVVDRAGVQTTYNPGIGGSRQMVALIPGDKVYLRVADPYGRVPLQFRDRSVLVRWHAVLFLPRLFDTVALNFTGSSAINALGFCAYTNQGVYSFYGTLPFNGSMSGPVNPDSIVTVTADGQEYGLVAARAVGDQTLHTLSAVLDYAGQVLNGPFTFKFYAAREAFGAHGEMDVWLDTDGTFPAYLRAGQFDAVKLSGTFYRKDAAPTDTDRNSYAVVTQTVAEAVHWPVIYDVYFGRVIVSSGDAASVSYQGYTYGARGWPSNWPQYDSGLSYVILDL